MNHHPNLDNYVSLGPTETRLPGPERTIPDCCGVCGAVLAVKQDICAECGTSASRGKQED